MEANTCDVDPPDGSYSNLSCHAIINNITDFLNWVKLLTKFALLTDCQRRAKQMACALTTATTQVLITLQTGSDANVLRQQIKQWTTVKHELVKSMQDEKKQAERSRFVMNFR